MRNSLELELNQSIIHANQSFHQKDYQTAVKKYSQCLFLYAQNKKYNESIATDFQLQLGSLKGLALMKDQKFIQAERQFDHCLIINPYNSLTLYRRAKLYMNLGRFGEAIEDIQKAMIYQPQNVEYWYQLDEICRRISQLNDQSQQNRLLFLIQSLRSKFSEISNQVKLEKEEEQQQDIFINFSKLKKIDRVSLKIVSNQKRKSILCFKQDIIVQYESNQFQRPRKLNLTVQEIKFKIKQQEQQLHKISQVQDYQQKVEVNVNSPLTRRKNLRNGSVFMSESSQNSLNYPKRNQFYSENNVISALSIKNIDGKILRNEENVRFVSSQNNFQEIQLRKAKETNKNMIQTKKSILRPSIKHTNRISENLFSHNQVNRSSFFGLKNIDGVIKKSNHILRKSQLIQNKQNINEYTRQQLFKKQLSDSSDDQINEHHVFEKTNQEQILKVLQNMKSISGGSQRCDGSEKSNSSKSILKNNPNIQTTRISIINNTNFNNTSNNRPSYWKKSTKSVCFKSTS